LGVDHRIPAAQNHQNARLVSDRGGGDEVALSGTPKRVEWTMPIPDWSEALNRFAILWPERMPATERGMKATGRYSGRYEGSRRQDGAFRQPFRALYTQRV